MLDSFFSRGFKASKCKTLLKLTVPRIKLLRNRREIQIKQMRREIANLLETGQEASAMIRVEHIIREEKMMAAQEIIELFCELITARLPIIDAQKECPLDMKEAISSVCFAAPRCADLPELQEVQMLFAGKYGKEFVSSATELMPESGVSRQLVELLSIRPPSPDAKLKLLKKIAEEHELDWDPNTSENELLKTHEDLLHGPVQLVSGRKVPFPKTPNDEAKSTTSEPAAGGYSDSDDDFEIIDYPEVPKQPVQSSRGLNSAPVMLPFPETALFEVDEQEPNPSRDKVYPSPSDPKVGLKMIPTMEEGAACRISTGQAENKQFVPFTRPPPELHENGAPPSFTKDNADLQEVVAAAQAAADTAENAAAAARSASSLAQLRINELVKKKNDDSSTSEAENPFHLFDKTNSVLQEEDDLDAENPFAHSTSPGRNSASGHWNRNLSHDANGGFDSYSESENAFSYCYGSVVNQPRTLSSMDEETYFSYPDLFTSQGSK